MTRGWPFPFIYDYSAIDLAKAYSHIQEVNDFMKRNPDPVNGIRISYLAMGINLLIAMAILSVQLIICKIVVSAKKGQPPPAPK